MANKRKLDFNQRNIRRWQLDNHKVPMDKFLGFGYTDPIYIDISSKKNKAKKAKRR
ncbi:MAG: hypothetical protein E6590_18170 [Clostridiales bacterium]|nr:hypothetical protein [Clostridiales bacterium]